MFLAAHLSLLYPLNAKCLRKGKCATQNISQLQVGTHLKALCIWISITGLELEVNQGALLTNLSHRLSHFWTIPFSLLLRGLAAIQAVKGKFGEGSIAQAFFPF